MAATGFVRKVTQICEIVLTMLMIQTLMIGLDLRSICLVAHTYYELVFIRCSASFIRWLQQCLNLGNNFPFIFELYRRKRRPVSRIVFELFDVFFMNLIVNHNRVNLKTCLTFKTILKA